VLIADCDCGGSVEFMIEGKEVSPITEECGDCGTMYQLNVRKVAKPVRDQ